MFAPFFPVDAAVAVAMLTLLASFVLSLRGLARAAVQAVEARHAR